MSEMWRIVDTGLRPAAQNIALNRALLEARQAEEIPSTLRFLRFTPSALHGCHQSAEQEFNRDYCCAHEITIQRRVTGGNAYYTDEAQLEWELYLHQRDVGSSDMKVIARRICHAAATAVSALGVDARFRQQGDIEVDGRKILESGCVCDGNAVLYQGTLLIDLDIDRMLRVIRVPLSKLSGATITPAGERIATLKDLLGYRVAHGLVRHYLTEAFESEFNVEFREADLTLTEHARYRTALAEIDTQDWIFLVDKPAADTPVSHAVHNCPGGVLQADLIYDRPRHRIKQIWFSGDIVVNPRRSIADLEAALRDTSIERLEHNIRMFFAGRPIDTLSPAVEDFIAVSRLAAQQPIVARSRA